MDCNSSTKQPRQLSQSCYAARCLEKHKTDLSQKNKLLELITSKLGLMAQMHAACHMQKAQDGSQCMHYSSARKLLELSFTQFCNTTHE